MLHNIFSGLSRGAYICALLLVAACSGESLTDDRQTTTVDPNEIQISEYVHETLPEELLLRIKGITDVFEPIDGVTYEQAIDLYRRDQNPESEIIVWEEMARTYSQFTENELWSVEKKQEVYKAVLLSSMFPKEEVLSQLAPNYLTAEDVEQLTQLYGLSPQPIRVHKE